MTDPRLSPGMAMRNPRRGKAHRGVPCRALYTGKPYVGSACNLIQTQTDAMTEAIPLDRTDPDDRCRRCWKETP